jgi:MtN3 and saliva related transmembrane protein
MRVAAIGLIAGALTTGAWLPQLYRTWRSRSADDLSWAYLLTTTTGIALWLSYGLFTRDVAVITANAVTIVLLSGQIVLKTSASRRLRSDLVELGEVFPGECERGRSDVLAQMDAR